MEQEQGIIYPPEWYTQEMVQLAWPDVHTDWCEILPEVQACYQNIINELSQQVIVLLLCKNQASVEALFAPEVRAQMVFAEVDYNDTWARDFGGITVFVDGQALVLDFAFNGWGMKFAANHDNCSNRKLKADGFFGRTDLINCKNVVLEGGSIESDGAGALLTTSVCLLSANRNDEWGKPELDYLLQSKLGVYKVLWLDHGLLIGDDTDGHIDTLARFAPGNRIVYCQCTDTEDPHYQGLQLMELELAGFTNCMGQPYELHPVPLPSAIYDDGDRLPATYVNYLIVNGTVLVPTYGTPEDKAALQAIGKAHPDHRIVGINCLALVKQHGSLHCITMNYPKGTIQF